MIDRTKTGAERPRQKEETMFKLVWKERPFGVAVIRTKTFADREQRFRFILRLEKMPGFVKVIEMN